MSDLDGRLLETIVQSLPLVQNPFAHLASRLGCSRQLILARLEAMLTPGGPIRKITGIFNAQALGYDQTLVALRLDDDQLNEAGAIVAQHPGVCHCYGRSGDYNLWFTLACSAESTLGIEGTIKLLSQLCSGLEYLNLPTVKRYKLDLPGALLPHQPPAKTPPITPAEITPDLRLAIRTLQQDLPIVENPFAALAKTAKMKTDELLAHANDLKARGLMRRYAALPNHRAIGAKENILATWQADSPADADKAGEICLKINPISHCYLRKTHENWPWNFYTMIHAPTRRQCLETIDQLASTAPLAPGPKLWTTHQFKKQRVKLFTNDEAKWEAKHILK